MLLNSILNTECIIQGRYLVSTLYSCAVRVLICYNLLLVEIFILYYVRMYVALDKIFHVWRHDHDTNSYTDEGRNWGLSLECARTDIMQDTGGRKVKGQASLFLIDVPLKFVVNVPS